MQVLRFDGVGPASPDQAEGRPAAIVHGGDLAGARRRFADAPTPWIDLSTGINPCAYPIGLVPAAAWQRLPDRSDVAALERAAQSAYGAAPGRRVIAAPGTQALIQLLPRLLPARRVGILGFGYQEHPAAWRAAGATVRVVAGLEDLTTADVAVVVNPNNPDGRLVAPAALAALARTLARRGGILVVDEAFMDVCDPAASLLPRLPEAGAVVLRSFGKFFGLAGLRLGFAVAGADLGERLCGALGPWAVSGPALSIATAALADTGWQRAAAMRLRGDAMRLDALLVQAGFAVLGGTSLFRLAGHADAAGWFDHLGRSGILTRPFAEQPGWLRFGLPGRALDWARLADALASRPSPARPSTPEAKP